MSEASALSYVRENSGSAEFWSDDGHRWRIESIRGDLPAYLRPEAADAYESDVRADGLLTLRYSRLTPSPLEASAESEAASIIRVVTSVLRAPAKARERLTNKEVRYIASRLMSFRADAS